LIFAGFAVPLSIVDLRQHRLPNALVAPFAVVMVVLLGVTAGVEDQWPAFGRALIAALVILGIALVCAGFGWWGMGDAKVSFPVALALGWLGWGAVWAGVLVAFTLAGVVGVLWMAARQRTWSSALPFGPFLFIGVAVSGVGAALGVI
jgi:leader peptidase (prepilin peptidase) / N-methyltransferase